MTWSALQYLKFEDERTRPARDLLAQIPSSDVTVAYDLGCGPGNSTELVAERFPKAETIGVDSDQDMLATARKRLPDIEFQQADLATWTPTRSADLLFANAVFQWIPDHMSVLNRLLDHVNSGGTLAVQMPDNLNEPTHLLMEEIARRPEFAQYFFGNSKRRATLPAPQEYMEKLGGKCRRVDIWHTVYYHKLQSAEAIVEWVKGTGLRPYLTALPEHLQPAFLSDYLAAITSAYPPMTDGSVLLKFPRFFLVAVKA